jgi:diguanylate cyclase (GGDEF)-like protein
MLRCLETTFVPQFSERGESVTGFHVMRQDITSTKLEERRLLSLASLDSLTGLANRNGFQQQLATAMARCRESGYLMALMYLDIDRFKPVNDTHGHNVGDALLRAFSSRLMHSVRSTDTVARLGGDEFTIILDKVSRPEDAAMIANKIVLSMRMPFDLDGTVVTVSSSVGVAFYQAGDAEDITSEELIRQADVMLYEAKKGGRDTFRVATLNVADANLP